MSNGTITTGHTRFIVASIAMLSAMALGAGTWLIFKGYQTGELLIQTGGTGVSGLLGFLGGKGMSMMMTPTPDATPPSTTTP